MMRRGERFWRWPGRGGRRGILEGFSEGVCGVAVVLLLLGPLGGGRMHLDG